MSASAAADATDDPVVVDVDQVRAAVGEAEWAARVDLAACYRLVALYGMSDLVYNHITARVPGRDDELLINPYGCLYEEITASSLIRIALDGRVLLQPDHGWGINPAGYVIHAALHRARHEVGCVIHTHSRAGMAVSAMRCGLLPLAQTSMRFYGRTSYHDFEGPALHVDEGERLVADLGANDTMVLRNHGLLVCGATVAEAFNRIYFLENACKLQVDAMTAGTELVMPSHDVAEATARAMQPDVRHTNGMHAGFVFNGSLEWRALRRRLDRLQPDYSS